MYLILYHITYTMGRHYFGQISGKFWFGFQNSDDASCFGVDCKPVRNFYVCCCELLQPPARCAVTTEFNHSPNSVVALRSEESSKIGEDSDDLTKEISASSLPKAEKIIEHINRSAQLFLKSQPDYNGCLTNARIALETLIRDIAESKEFKITSENKAWGSSLAHLRTINFLNEKEEKTIASIYGFVSDGAHIPLGFTEEEYARFGRNLVTSICYFIAKLLSAT